MASSLDLNAVAETNGGGPFDEMVTGHGSVRQHWQSMATNLSALGATGLALRAERGRQYLEDEGVTYNLYEIPEERPRSQGFTPPVPKQRPWQLDPVPLVMAADEWAGIEAGLIQRAELLDEILRDLYGPMRLLHEKRYPPALVFAHRNFFRPMRFEERTADGRMLQHYAAELVRGPDGEWRVLADRAQSPAGAGYALQNRRVMSRLQVQAMRGARLRPLNSFFEYWQSDLSGRANTVKDNPRIAVWTPGPYNEAYFEHIYLARELGATLVEGADLTMREGGIFLKTMQGLEQIDVILRRVDGEWCDPLELRPDSSLGIPGLVEAIRLKRVSVCNAIGSGLVESPALQAFLPTLCQHLRGEPLRLPSIASWWCGQPGPREEALRDLDRMVVRSALDLKQPAAIVDELGDQARAALEADIRANPLAYVTQERITPSVAPGLGEGGLTPQPVLLRVFVVADGDRYVVMPGGLALVPHNGDAFRANLQRGGVSKDIWVMAEEPVPTLIRGTGATQPLAIVRSSGTLQSRVADDLYWLGRHVDRLASGARLLRSALARLVGEFASPRDLLEFRLICRTMARCGFISPIVAESLPDSAALGETILGIFGPDAALGGILDQIKRLVVQVRHRFSADMWRLFNHLLGELALSQRAASQDADAMTDFCDQVLRATAAISGVFAEHMTRGSGWRFIDVGRRMERSLHVIRLVLATSQEFSGNRDLGFRLTLELNDASLTYRRRYRAALQAAPVLDLVLLDKSNPQSLNFQLREIERHLERLPGDLRTSVAETCQHIVAPLDAMVQGLVAGGGEPGDWPGLVQRLHDALTRADVRLTQVSDHLSRAYFSHTRVARSFGVGD